MNDSYIIFIGGVHGAGKGFLCNEICSITNAQYLSASKLVRWEKRNIDVKNKLVENIPNMQEILIKQLSKKCSKGKFYLLDGHYCLLDSNSVPTAIDVSVFNDIDPKIILLVTANPDDIKKRLERRDRKIYDLDLIIKMQTLEMSHSQMIAKKLNVPFFRINDNNKIVTLQRIKELI